MDERVRKIGRHFEIGGEVLETAPLGGGHIHETLAATVLHGADAGRYVFQRVNEDVFRDAEGLMRNLVRLTEHLRAKLRERAETDSRRCLSLVPALAGGYAVRDAEGALWRVFVFIEGAHPAPVGGGRTAEAREAARAFGAFAADCADLSTAELVETIPGFHDLAGRGAALEQAVNTDPCGRVGTSESEITLAREALEAVHTALRAGGAEALPRRVVHNDCKLDNVMLDDASGEGLCVIDLDTTMAGTLLCDFGAIARTGTCQAAEDERDLDRIIFDAGRFASLASGYLEGIGDLVDAERDNLWLAGPLMTLEDAVRFLTDHLTGDTYYRIHREGHNLDRARAQLRLFSRMWEARDLLRASVDQASSLTGG